MRNKILTTIVTLPLLAVMLYSGYKLELKLNEYRMERSYKTEISKEVRTGKGIDIEKLKQRNGDVKAWLYLPDSQIDYPVVQGKDNDYYLHRDLDGNYLYDGTLFIDASNDDPFNETNTVIYGHHMFSGAMFCGLEKFADEEYFDSHSVFQLTTDQGEYDIHVIAYCNESSDSDLYTLRFREQDFTEEDFVSLIRQKAKVLSDEPFDTGDRFITMSTCAYNYKEARHQVIGVIRPPEQTEKETSVYAPEMNIWLIAQIAVAAVMGLVVLSLPVRAIRSARKKKRRE